MMMKLTRGMWFGLLGVLALTGCAGELEDGEDSQELTIPRSGSPRWVNADCLAAYDELRVPYTIGDEGPVDEDGRVICDEVWSEGDPGTRPRR